MLSADARHSLLSLVICVSIACCVLADPCEHSIRETYDLRTDDRAVNYSVHAFYYTWYGNLAQDGKWLHWDHELLPDYSKPESHEEERRVDEGLATRLRYDPDRNLVASSYYPSLGPYSSADECVIKEHMKYFRHAGIGVAVISWWGRAEGDRQLHVAGMDGHTDAVLRKVFDIANAFGVKIAVHLEPYEGRTAASVRDDIEHLLHHFSGHPSLYTVNDKPVFYIYDPYHMPPAEWARIFSDSGDLSVRGTSEDVVALSLVVSRERDLRLCLEGGFDGIYTYFATDGFSYGSSTQNWASLREWSRKNGKLFVPSCGPGYDDTAIRPWNGRNKRDRKRGAYFTKMIKSALAVRPDFISLTSFNEWGEGTQIEPAVPQNVGFTVPDDDPRLKSYNDYDSEPLLYLDLSYDLLSGVDEERHSHSKVESEEEFPPRIVVEL